MRAFVPGQQCFIIGRSFQWLPKSQTVSFVFFRERVQMFMPIVGIVATTEPSWSLQTRVVFPAASSPNIKALNSLFPNMRQKILDKTVPIFAIDSKKIKILHLISHQNPIIFTVSCLKSATKKPMKKLALLFILIALSASQEETFVGRIFAGYQGWFTGPDDGLGNGWNHWKWTNDGPFSRTNCIIDLFPYPEEYERKYYIPEMPGWSVFSAADYSTVRTHFRWAKENKIHGLFLQRFGVDIRYKGSTLYNHKTRVFENVMNAAKQTGLLWGLMYDLTNLEFGQIRSIIMDDFRWLKRTYPGFLDHPTYVKHKGRPLITVYGMGYNDNRKYTLAQSAELVDFLKNDPECGGNTINLSTPRYWREGGRDAVTGNDLKLFHNIILKSDVVTPWAVGRYRTIDQARNDARVTVKGDVAWCNQNKLVLMPVIFPGFSWHNLQASGENPDHPGPYNEIPRKQNGLYFLQEQGVEVIKAGARTIYVAMFDEMNEGTAIFKCATNPPSLADGLQFVPYEEDPAFYMRMTGEIGKMLS